MKALGFRSFPVFANIKRSQSGSQSTPETREARRPSVSTQNGGQKFVILMRHGMTDWNQDGRIQGSLDRSRLNSTGVKQARHAGRFLSGIPFDSILCSPLHRARQTLELVASVSQNPRLQRLRPELLEDLKEIQVPWQGALRREVPHGDFREWYLKYKRNPHSFSYFGFSPMDDLLRRAQHAWEIIMRSSGNFHLVVAHNQMNKALICTALGIQTCLRSWNQGNCCFNLFVVQSDKPPILRLCNGSGLGTSHYAPRRAHLRPNWTRVFLYQAGSVTGLRQEVRKLPIAHLFCVNHETHEIDYNALGKKYLRKKSTSLYFQEDGINSTYQECCQFLDQIRTTFVGQHIIIRLTKSRLASLLFAAALGLHPHESYRFHTDPGGVTIVDLSSESSLGVENVRVDSFNAHANSSNGPLLGYTFGIGGPTGQF
ncbi:Histidine phosphatase [Gracilaria domingensis]|nr:Histidine phosphatase [Gracilaria domingensis]